MSLLACWLFPLYHGLDKNNMLTTDPRLSQTGASHLSVRPVRTTTHGQLLTHHGPACPTVPPPLLHICNSVGTSYAWLLKPKSKSYPQTFPFFHPLQLFNWPEGLWFPVLKSLSTLSTFLHSQATHQWALSPGCGLSQELPSWPPHPPTAALGLFPILILPTQITAVHS